VVNPYHPLTDKLLVDKQIGLLVIQIHIEILFLQKKESVSIELLLSIDQNGD
jgi:hypothetical protein